VAWRLGLLLALALAPVGCAHQSGARVPDGPPAAPAAASMPASDAPREEVPAVAAPADPSADNLSIEEEFDLLETPIDQVSDPLAPWNRAMFVFNDKFYFWILKPVTLGYRKVVPSLARTGVSNFFDNLRAPLRFASNVLQFKGREATIELGKFMINSTWGVLGFGNLFAGNPETKLPDTDLGLAMAHHGVGPGPYVVWPFLGPYTLRDSFGWLGGMVVDPLTYIDSNLISLGGRTYYLVNYTSFRIGDYESIKDASIDPYLAARDAYLQYRAKRAKE